MPKQKAKAGKNKTFFEKPIGFNTLLLCNKEFFNLFCLVSAFLASGTLTYLFSKSAVKNHNSEPNKIEAGYSHDVCVEQNNNGYCLSYGDTAKATATCSDITIDLLRPTFLHETGIPYNYHNTPKYIEFFQFLCGQRSNITLGETTTFSNGCDDAPYSGDRSNVGQLQSLILKFTTRYNVTTTLNLLCKNGQHYPTYTALASVAGVFLLITACVICCYTNGSDYKTRVDRVNRHWKSIFPTAGQDLVYGPLLSEGDSDTETDSISSGSSSDARKPRPAVRPAPTAEPGQVYRV